MVHICKYKKHTYMSNLTTTTAKQSITFDGKPSPVIPQMPTTSCPALFTNIKQCWLYNLPINVLDIIYEFDPTYHHTYRETIAEFGYIMKKNGSHRLRKECYENMAGYSCSAFMRRIIPPLYKQLPYFLPPTTHRQSNIFRPVELYCMKYPYNERCKKQEYIKTIKQFSHHCHLCDSTNISPFRYKLKKPFEMYLFCSYTCHKKYYENIDTHLIRGYMQRPVFDKYNMSTMERCYLPNYWHLNPENEQWEIVWTDGVHPYDRPIQKGYY